MTPSLRTLRKIADAFSVSIPELLEPPARGESVHISRKGEHPLVSFEDSSERWMVLGARLFEGKIRAVIATLDGGAGGVSSGSSSADCDRDQNPRNESVEFHT
jgi:hypothetical protein